MSDKIVYTSDENFEADVLNSGKPVLLDFWADWCGPCKMIAPILEEIAVEQSGSVQVAKVNVDEAPELARRFEGMSLPTLIRCTNGQPTTRIVGAKGKSQLLEELASHL